MASLLTLLSQRQPNLQTRKGLILTGLQNDFLSPDGKLPVSSEYDYIDRIRELVPSFRDFGDVVWVRSQYEADREVTTGIHEAGDSVIAGPLGDYTGGDDESDDDRDSPVPFKKARTSVDDRGGAAATQTSEGEESGSDEELFLTNSSHREACCMKGTRGVEFADQIADVVGAKDLQVIKTYYSAFGATSLLLTLRSRLITELFVGGNMTNLSVFATAMDAARYGIKITLIEDCLGYRNKSRHDAAIRTLKEVMGADVMTAAQVLEGLRNPPAEVSTDEEDEEEDDIAFGEDASGVPLDHVEADSDEGEQVFELPATVRSRLTSTTGLLHTSKPSAAEIASSRDRAADQQRAPHSRRHSSAADKPGFDREQTADEPSIGSDQNRVEPGVDGSSDLSTGGMKDDSSAKVRVKASLGRGRWAHTIGAEWAQKNQEKHGQLAHSSHPGLGAIAALVGLDQRTVDEYEAMMKAFKDTSTDGEPEAYGRPLFGEDKESESAGSRIFYDLLPADLAEMVFDQLNAELAWQTMHHQTGEVPRLVCCQGTIDDDGSMPVYRHPSDQTLPITRWTPIVDRVRKAAEDIVGHPLNHALIQLYRGGADFISEHSDKTLDIAKGSSIVNVSFGAQRTMRLRTKRGVAGSASSSRITHRVPMPHNSMITMSLPTNAEYLHGINADKRPRVELTEEEKAFGAQRISLTFRHISTFLSVDSTRIWGQGATGKAREDARPVINGDAAESERLVKAFGAENQASSIDWLATYGGGFDVLHLR